MINRPIMRYHGGKFRLAQWVMSFFPEHTTYVEPFGGAAGVLLQKERSYAEVYNDLDSEIVNVFRVIQDNTAKEQLIEKLKLTPYAREEFNLAQTTIDCPIEQARRTLIRAYMGFGSAGACVQKTGFRIDSGRNYATAFHLWAEVHSYIDDFADRFKGVLIENRDACKIIDNHDREDTLFFVDPPYLHDTRVMSGNRYYRHEMTDLDHKELIKKLKQASGMVVLSGYESDLYKSNLTDWEMHKTSSRIAANRGSKLRTEVIWLNPAAAKHQKQISLFTEQTA